MSSMISTATVSGGVYDQMLNAVRPVYSTEIYFQALPQMRMSQFATRKEELRAQAGSQIRMPKMGAIRRGGALTEGTRIQTKTMNMSEMTIDVRERGNAIAITERLLITSFFDTLAVASMQLARDYSLVNDLELRDVARVATNKVYAGEKTSRNTLTNSDVFTTREIYKAAELAAINNVPKFFNDYWVIVAHPHQLSTLKQSQGWINAAQYAGSQAIYFGEVGRFNDVRFVESSMMANGFNPTIDAKTLEAVDPGYDSALNKVATGALTADVIYQAILIGDFGYGHAVALPVEMRDDGVADFGREHAIAWYDICGSGLLEGQNLVVIESA